MGPGAVEDSLTPSLSASVVSRNVDGISYVYSKAAFTRPFKRAPKYD